MLKGSPPVSPFLPHLLGLTTAVEALQLILRPPTEEIVREQRVKNKAATEVLRIDLSSNPNPRTNTSTIKRISMPPQPTNNNKRSFRSSPTALFPIGTIIRRRCENDNIFYGGEVTAYGTTNDLYHIKCREGDTDDFIYDKLKKYKKVQQKYRKVLKLLQIETPTTKSDHEHDIFLSLQKLIPTQYDVITTKNT